MVNGQIDHMNKIWSVEKAQGIMEEIDQMNSTFIEAKEQIINYIKGHVHSLIIEYNPISSNI